MSRAASRHSVLAGWAARRGGRAGTAGGEYAPGQVRLAGRVVAVLGGRYSAELGIDVDAGDAEVERWFVAATLFGARSGLLLVIGCFNLLDGIAAIANSRVFIGNAHYVAGGLRAWGWVMTIFGAVQVLAVTGVWAGNQMARWFAVAVVGLNGIGQMFFIPAYPFFSLMIIAVDVVALWGLCAYGSRENLDAA